MFVAMDNVTPSFYMEILFAFYDAFKQSTEMDCLWMGVLLGQ